MNVFSKNEPKLSGGDFINKKRNVALYCDLKNNKNKNAKKIGCVKNNKLYKALNHSELMKLQKGYHEYYQTIDISSTFFTTHDGQVFSKNNHNVNCDNLMSVYDYSNNYTGSMLTNYEDGLQKIEDSAIFFRNKFVGLDISNNAVVGDIAGNTKYIKTNCFDLHASIKI